MSEMNKLSIVIPVYNEQNTLAELVRRVLAVEVPLEKELVLVDDASADGSDKVIEEICRNHESVSIKVVTHEKNQGKGASLRDGFAQVSGDIVVIQDADLEYDPNDYPRLLNPILDGRADVVYGSRFSGGEEHRVMYFWHFVGNQIVTTLSNMCTNLNLTDMETCYKVFRREVVEGLSIKSNRFGVEPEMTAKIARAGWRVYEVGISYSGRTYAEGKKITWKDGMKALFTILRFRFFN
jgi:glycosyltransferase involved in cell wall biosynthesis